MPPRGTASVSTAIGLIGTAAAMPVARELLTAAADNDHAAIDMVSIWGHGLAAPSSAARWRPGLWMLGGGERLLERARPGVLSRISRPATPMAMGSTRGREVTVPATRRRGRARPDDPGASAGSELAAALPECRAWSRSRAPATC